MKLKIIAIILFVIFGGTSISFSQQFGVMPKLVPLGVITPDGERAIFQMSEPTAKQLIWELGVRTKEGDVPFVYGNSWEAVVRVAKASSEDLTRTVADLLVRVDNLEKRVTDLERRSR